MVVEELLNHIVLRECLLFLDHGDDKCFFDTEPSTSDSIQVIASSNLTLSDGLSEVGS